MAWARYRGSPTDLHSTRSRRVVFPDRTVNARSQRACLPRRSSVIRKVGRSARMARPTRASRSRPAGIFTFMAIFTVRVNYATSRRLSILEDLGAHSDQVRRDSAGGLGREA